MDAQNVHAVDIGGITTRMGRMKGNVRTMTITAIHADMMQKHTD